MSWIYYLLEANLYLAGFYLLYYLLLRRETWYQLNRVYLLASSALAFVLPFLQLGMLKHPLPPPPPPMAPVINFAVEATTKIPVAPVIPVHVWTAADYSLLAYGLIASALLLNFCIKLFKLIRLSRSGKNISAQPFKLVEIANDNDAFSFFNYLFVDPKLIASEIIINHELVHIRQKHSWDIVYLELLKIINWFNPAVYLLQNSIKEVHEFIADQQTTQTTRQDVDVYTDFLISNAYGMPQTTLTNNLFNKNLLKRRIMMLHQKRSGSLARLKYLTAVPLFAGMLCVSTLSFSKDYGWIDLAPYKHDKDSTAKLPPPPPASPRNALGQNAAFRFPAPTVLRTNYQELGNFMFKNVNYPKDNKSGKSALVIASFDLNGNGMISNVGIVKSAGNDFDQAVIQGMQEYSKPINDKAGKYQIGFSFYSQTDGNQVVPGREQMEKSDFVGEVSLANQVALPPPPPPAFIKPNYKKMADYLYWHAKYPEAAKKARLNRTVAADFKVNNDGKIAKVTIVQSAGKEFDDAAIKAVEAYPYNDYQPGDYRIGINFMAEHKKTAPHIPQLAYKYKQAPNFVGEVYVMSQVRDTNKVKLPPPPPPAPPVSKNTKLPPPPPPAPPVKSDEKKAPPPPPAPPVNEKDKAAPTAQQAPSADFADLYQYLMKHIRYPAKELKDTITGRVFVTFTLSPDRHIENLKVVRGRSIALNSEVIRQMQNFQLAKGDPNYGYAIPINFALKNQKNEAWLSAKKDKSTGTSEISIANTSPVNNHKPAKNYMLNEVIVVGYVN